MALLSLLLIWRWRYFVGAGVAKYRLCSVAQYVNLVGVTIGYTITTAISMGYLLSTIYY